MSVPNQTPYNIYTANGLTTVFPYEFYLLNAGDIAVSINGTVITSGYTITGVGNVDGGDITFLTPPANGVTVMLERVIPTYRLTDYQDNGDLLADTVNKDFDRLWMAIQQAFIYLGLALTRPLLGGPFNAKKYRIENVGDPVNDQDAVNRRSMYSCVEKMIAGVVGGFGWFRQFGAGAIDRTFQDKMRERLSVIDFGADTSRQQSATITSQNAGIEALRRADAEREAKAKAAQEKARREAQGDYGKANEVLSERTTGAACAAASAAFDEELRRERAQ
ncbi:hypothetical protein JOE25_000556 [Serratia sp. PL17]|uniref:phage tail fiber domain-containing protein n=1 Tax=Serratia sp. PL17 TaxID=2806582 RepID=UPI001B762D8E|nr:phage tail fiber protein [Serratia sp. PL17]MBP1129013.1 hypothetical protein [Serratia sp. PL17]